MMALKLRSSPVYS